MARITVTLGLAFVLAATALAGDEAQWQQALADFNRFSNSKDPSERARAAESIGGATFEKHDKQAVQLVCALMSAELGRDRGGTGKDEEKISGDVLDACENAFKKITSKDALDQMLKLAKDKGQNARVRFYLCRGLGGMKDAKDAVKTLIELVDDKDTKIQIGALDGLVASKDASALDTYLKVLQATDRTWECKYVSITGVEAVGDQSDRVVDALIDALGKCKADEGRIKVEIMRVLGIFLKIKEPKSDDPNWWKAAKKDSEAPVKEGQTTIEPTEFFGLKTKSSRIVFILDRTGSMMEPCTWPEQPKKEPPKERPGVGTDGKKIDENEEAARQRAAEVRKKYDDRKVTAKIDGLKREFINTIYNLDPRVHFTVIWYESNPTFWKEQLVPANWKNKLECIQDIDRLNPSGPTNIWGALEMAFRLVEQPNKPDVVAADKKGNYATVINGPDTFYLMTDGLHNTGKFTKDQGGLPGCDDVGFVAELKKVNALRKIIIHTIVLGDLGTGLPQNAINLMKKIADETGGKPAHIGK